MSKFKNTAGMSQVVVLQGKKTIVEDNGVIEVEAGWAQVGFDQVADDVAATVVAGSIRRRRFVNEDVVNQFESKLQDVLTDKDRALEQANEKVQELAKISEENSNNFKREFDELKKLTLEISKQLEIMQKDSYESKALTNKRLGLLKGAVQAIELELEQLPGEIKPGKK